MNLPKIRLGKSTPAKNHFPLPIDSNTTCDWGFVQPMCKVALIPQSKLNVKLSSFVRLSSMNVPTFGRVEYRTYHRFVPIADLWAPFEAMLSGNPYNTSVQSVVPTQVPQVYLDYLTDFCLFRFKNVFTVYSATINNGNTSAYTPVSNSSLAAYIEYFNENHNPWYYEGISIDANCATNQSDAPGSAFAGSKAINPNSSDYNIIFSPTTGLSLMFCFRLNQLARNFRKVLLGLGYQLNHDDHTSVSLLPLYAYYKAYFDYFAPQQDVTWTSTAAYRSLDYYRERPSYTGPSYFSLGSDSSDNALFLFGLAECYYTEDPNFVSAHIATPAISSSAVSLDVSKTASLQTESVTTTTTNRQPFIAANTGLSANLLNVLNRLNRFVNKRSVSGGHINDFLKAVFGADYVQDDRSYHIGSNVLQCQISDVYSTTENSDVALGEYTGKGIGYNEGNKLEYFTSTFGYYICLGVIVPNSNFAQQLDPTLKHRSRFEFYHGDFDAVGFQITQKDCIFGANDDSINATKAESDSFGFIPRYSEYKTSRNIINGMISLRSTRTSYLPYTLDKFISPNYVVGVPVDTNGTTIDEDDTTTEVAGYKLQTAVHDIPIASTAWRYIGKYNWLGNFNRIFNNEGYEDANYQIRRLGSLTAAERMLYDPIDDNFIVHNLFDIHVNAPMLSMSDSFDTDSFDKDAISVEKA